MVSVLVVLLPDGAFPWAIAIGEELWLSGGERVDD